MKKVLVDVVFRKKEYPYAFDGQAVRVRFDKRVARRHVHTITSRCETEGYGGLRKSCKALGYWVIEFRDMVYVLKGGATVSYNPQGLA